MQILKETRHTGRRVCAGVRRGVGVAAVCGVLAVTGTACDGAAGRQAPGGAPGAASASPGRVVGARLPGVGDRMWSQVPADSGQAVVVYGESPDSPESTAVLYERRGPSWERTASWPAHNGRLGWTTDHRMDDEQSPVGVFTLTDAGGSLADPGSRLRYWQDDNAFVTMLNPGETHTHDFDYVIAIDYNRLRGVPPFDWSRPDGVERGGGIWLHLDHGDGTSACVSLPEAGMKTLLRTLDPTRRPVVVMGDRDRLAS
ncbi:L,D-transpeptidase family protein [Streptomyces sp. LP11]|uniref:L,D-transpeptidase family protein n=1 Tax=Streptomyces pyxinicus TaxID=2970331 RepID=A0ABT2B3M0_9ACTN|nr:L,D-transpeptidase family protein [Streptomyces sp. LP11]MCS0603047.1 L,D-transpeptidase family protein [Streptomyces sp. LP11]